MENKTSYTIIPVYSDDGCFSHNALIETETGIKVWSEDPEECKAQGYAVLEKATEELRKENDELKSQLLKCVQTFDLIESIIEKLKSANSENLEIMVEAIDIDFKSINKSISETLLKYD